MSLKNTNELVGVPGDVWGSRQTAVAKGTRGQARCRHLCRDDSFLADSPWRTPSWEVISVCVWGGDKEGGGGGRPCGICLHLFFLAIG